MKEYVCLLSLKEMCVREDNICNKVHDDLYLFLSEGFNLGLELGSQVGALYVIHLFKIE